MKAKPKKVMKAMKAVPAGTVRNIGFKPTWSVAEGDHKRSRNVYTCKQYDRAKRRIKIHFPRMSHDDKRATLSNILKLASDLYSAKNT